MVRISTLASAFAAFAAVGCAADIDAEFEQYVKDFQKTYRDERERAARKRAFEANLEFIQRENAKGHSYTLGLNHFADMTPEEFSMTKRGLRQADGSQWGDLPYLGRHERRNVTLAAEVDWRSQNAVTPIKDQGGCSSCWAFSVTGALEGAWKIATGNLVPLSEQQLVDCASNFPPNRGCGGGFMDSGFQYTQGVAMCREDSYPYEAKDGICRAASCAAGIPQGGILGYKDVQPGDVQAMVDAVSQQPVSVGVDADQSFGMYKSGVLTAPCGTSANHGVLVVGYGTENGLDYWLVKNSWGNWWGMDGYAKLSRGQPGAGECGIQQYPSYPVVKPAREVPIRV